MIVCTYESRIRELTGVKLLVLSLARHCPGLSIDLTVTSLDPRFADWVASHPHVRVHERPELDGMRWNVKPTLMLELLDAGHDSVVWMDSDVITTRDFRPLLQSIAPETFVAAQDTYWGQHQGGTHRTVSWGLPPGRDLPWTALAGVVRATPAHRRLLERWKELMEDPVYLRVQDQPWYERPMHMLGDSEVLTAVLGSKEFSDVPVRLLRRGREIINNLGPAGYTVGERLYNVRHGLAALVPSMGVKPWQFDNVPSWSRERKRYYQLVFLELSPYVHLARQYRDEMGEPCDWMDVRTAPARFFRAITRGEPSLQGLPQAALDSVVRRTKRVLHLSEYRVERRLDRSIHVPWAHNVTRG